MFRSSLAVVVLVLVVPLIALDGAAARAQSVLDVMTFNIRTAAGRDGKDAWSLRRDLVVEPIRASAPDLIGMQEALDSQIEYLQAALPEYRWLGIDRGLNGGVGLSEYTPIFYRYSELSPIESGNFWLTDTPDTPPLRTSGRRRRSGGRIVTWARFHHRLSGQQIYAFNTHFTLRRGAPQLASAELVAGRVAALPAGTPVVVLGDFNNDAEVSDTWRVATGHGLRDVWVEAAETHGPRSTYGDFGPPRPDLTERVDWMLGEGPILVRRAETIVHNDEGRFPSDHYPVTAVLEVQ